MYDSTNIKIFTRLFSGFIIFQLILFFQLKSLGLLVFGCILLIILSVNSFWVLTRNVHLSAHILNQALILYIGVLCYKTGGIFSIAIFLLMLIPVLTTVFMNGRDKLIYIVCGIIIFIIFCLAQTGLLQGLLSNDLVNINVFRISQLTALFILAGSCIWILGKKAERDAALKQEYEKECSRISDEAQSAMKIKDQFLANMSHEIRNPMNGIIGMMHVLLDSDLDDGQRRNAKIVYNSARALLSIVNDILDLSKIKAGKLEFDIRNFDLEIAVKDIVSLPELQARQKGVEFSYNIAPEVPCLLKGDIGRIRQILNNLTGNAIKFTEAGEVILTVTLKSEDDGSALVHFSVEDTGIGIKEEHVKTLFQSFTQADSSITKRYGGTGLGLSISKLLVERMGGRIGVDSIEMIGSTFWFELTLTKQAKDDRPVTPLACDVDNCKILVLSDGASLGLNFEKILFSLDFEYEQAFDETEAMEMLRWAQDEDAPFNLVILEAKESDIVAQTLGRKIQQDGQLSKARLILLTAVGKKGDARKFEEIGFSAFLSKPIEKDLLVDVIRAVLSLPDDKEGHTYPIITKYSIIENRKKMQKILIVEDMETNLLTAKALISKLGYHTDEARNGKEAVKKVTENSYDLVLMDCQMPVLDGFEATRQIRKHENDSGLPQVPIVAMTGNAFESDRKKCFEAGMNDFLAKPVEPDMLSDKIGTNLTASDGAKDMETIRVLPSEESAGPEERGVVESSVVDNSHDGQDGEQGQCFNKEQLFERFGQDQELVEVILESFFEEAPELLENIETAISENDVEAVQSNAHALKGSSANVNAELLRNAALSLETLAKEGDQEQFGHAFERLGKEYDNFIQEASD